MFLVVSLLPLPGNYKILVVQSGSMEPSIKTGSVVVVKPASDYKVGDVITFGPFSKTKPPTAHRIYQIKEKNGQIVYITKGDANNSPDQSFVDTGRHLWKTNLSFCKRKKEKK
ncbi:MAG: signal peptidase I [Candidatus Pacebacteria bacterium]|nr:signal peptidase I [Candidatus Paceibacterota bacterium]